jgi:hypothetical protein
MDLDDVRPVDLEMLAVAFPPVWREPALGWEAVRIFEAMHSVVLPEPYRTFVAEFSDGSGRGPSDEGLFALDEIPSHWWGSRSDRNLAAPFPLTEKWIWEDDPRPQEEKRELIHRTVHHGSLLAGAESDGSCWHLVITGPQRGRIWLIGEVGAYGFGTDFAYSATDAGFAGWVAYWQTGAGWSDELP